tara:strand:+ start:725 stop:898 length:174 start_codon:yes stop_codon:yes gene_type:complete
MTEKEYSDQEVGDFTWKCLLKMLDDKYDIFTKVNKKDLDFTKRPTGLEIVPESGALP